METNEKEELTKILNELKKARNEWCGGREDDWEEMWTEVPSLLSNIVPRIEKLLGIPPTGLNIIAASYGTTETFIDVTEVIQRGAYYNKLEIYVNNNTFKNDPIFGQTKSLKIIYDYDGKEYLIEAKENSKLVIDEQHKDGLIS